ncbi:MAG: sulfotransferase [Thiohalocapsa sp.]|nr:sulfotransferase [Thiohalocapsa sp.]MCF7992251.1 sulfotransferase [Thiohalocapsa sp.]
MFDLFLISLRRHAAFSLQSLSRSADGRAPVSARRILVMLGFLPVFALVQAIHWLGFLLDEVFYRGYRRVQVREPLFVLGVPRSGTTKLHTVLARDPQYTTFSTWECLFALSVSERRFWLALARADAALGQPLGRLIGWIERRIFAGLDDVHAMSLTTPEEDYFALMPAMSCFILFLPFPAAEHLWRMGRFDRDMPERERRRLLDFYESCLKRHLYVHGPEKRLLSKNAAFAPLAQSLAQRFPDARFLVCLRDPAQTVPSQLSSIESGLRFFGVPPDSAPIRERLLDQLGFYYENLAALDRALPTERCATTTLPRLSADLGGALRAIYDQLGLPMSSELAEALASESTASRRYRSRHRYSLQQFDLDAAQLAQRFAAAYTHPALQQAADASAEADASSPVSERPAVGSRIEATSESRGAVSC